MENNGTLINTKRTRVDEDHAGRDRIVLTFTAEQAAEILKAFVDLEGEQVNFDVRTKDVNGKNGAFKSSFVIIKRMIPKSETVEKQAVSKTKSYKDKAKKISEELGG